MDLPAGKHLPAFVLPVLTVSDIVDKIMEIWFTKSRGIRPDSFTTSWESEIMGRNGWRGYGFKSYTRYTFAWDGVDVSDRRRYEPISGTASSRSLRPLTKSEVEQLRNEEQLSNPNDLVRREGKEDRMRIIGPVVEPFLNITSILMTCRKMSEVGRERLYGSNLFVFAPPEGSTVCTWPMTHPDIQEFQPYLLPGTPNQDGSVKTKKQNEAAVMRLMRKQKHNQAKFANEDPMSNCFRRIGKQNTKLIRQVKIVGVFTCGTVWQDGRLAGHLNVLPIYGVLLRSICPNLKEAILHRFNITQEEISYAHKEEHNDELREVLTSFISTLKSLEKLRLGCDLDYVRRPWKDEWKSLRSVEQMVIDRDLKQAADVRGWNATEVKFQTTTEKHEAAKAARVAAKCVEQKQIRERKKDIQARFEKKLAGTVWGKKRN